MLGHGDIAGGSDEFEVKSGNSFFIFRVLVRVLFQKELFLCLATF
jgi:hypothetical protein